MVIDRIAGTDEADEAWPAISYESHPWVSESSAMMSRTQKRLHAGSYNAAIVPTIADRPCPRLAAETLARSGEAVAAIVRFDAGMGPALLPFSSLLLRSESAASSRIENLTASAKAVALAELGDPRPSNGNIIVANSKAMVAAVALADRLDSQAILDTHRALLERSAPTIAGRWRQQQVWIGGTGFGPHRAEFVPPHHERVPGAVEDLVRFMSRDDYPILAQTAIAHAQFESIHPFADGNGRTGRALVHALLRAKDIARNVSVPISAGLLVDTGSYFEALTTYRAGDPDPIVRMVADATMVAIEHGETLIEELDAIRTQWSDRIRARADSSAWRIADLLLRQPIVESSLVMRELALSRPNTLRAIDRLVDAGVVTELSGASRNRRWAALEILAALDAFAARAGRRTQSR